MTITLPTFSWFSSSKKLNPTKQEKRKPNVIDHTEELQCNNDLTYGLWHNQYPGMKLAGALAYNPIAIPVWFMGLPIPKSDNEADQKMLTAIAEQFTSHMKGNHIMCHRDGTTWIWPFWSSKDNELHWEFIPDASVVNIVRDIETKRVVQIDVDEQLLIATTTGTNAEVRRKRTFTAELVTEQWSGQNVPEDLKGRTMRNVHGYLPICFANNADPTEVRGHSDYERIIYDMKDYHDIDLMQSTVLAKFTPKMLWKVKDVRAALDNNGLDSLADVDVALRDLFMYVEGEDIDFAFPDNAHLPYESALKRKFIKMVEGSGVPEICWGVKTEGNHASAEEQMGMLVQFVQDKREQSVESYKKLFAASLRLMQVVGMRSDTSVITIAWGSLDELSAKTKSEIFRDFAEGVAKLVDSASLTKTQLYKLWRNLYPETTTEEYNTFVKEISFMAKHKQFKDASYLEAMDDDGGVE